MLASRLRITLMGTGLILGAALLAAASSGGTRGAEDNSSRPLSREALDARISEALRRALDEGADLYNEGSPTACVYLFRGALTAVHPLLDHHARLQKAIERGLADTQRLPMS